MSKKETKVEVNFFANIQIDLVQGNELRNYEIFFLATTLALSTAVSFWTSYATTPNSTLLFSAIAFSILTSLSGLAALHYRSKVYTGKIKKTTSLSKFGSKT